MPRLDDGHSTTVAFAEDATVAVEVKSITPVGVQGGGEIDTTTMENNAWRTKAPKKLKTLSPMTLTVAYAVEAFEDLEDMVNINQLITITWPDGYTIAFWGWIDEFNPSEVAEGEQPEAEIVVIPSNQNDSGVETGMVVTAPGD